MSLVSLVAALLLEQWRPLADRRYLYQFLARYATSLESLFNAGETHQGMVAWLVAIVPAVLVAWIAYAMAGKTSPVLAFGINVAALYLTMGFRQRSHFFTDIHAALKEDDLAKAREELTAWLQEDCSDLDREAVTRLALEEALISSHRCVFGVIFWFVLLPGPTGAIVYRLSMFLSDRWRESASPGLERFSEFARKTFAALDVRLGMPVVLGKKALDRPPLGLGDPADIGHMDSLIGLVWRALVMWLL